MSMIKSKEKAYNWKHLGKGELVLGAYVSYVSLTD